MSRALALDSEEEWGLFEVDPQRLRHEPGRFGLSITDTKVPVIALASGIWSVCAHNHRTWPWVQGRHLSGGMYSHGEGRIIPFHKDDVWYQIALPIYAVVPVGVRAQARELVL